MSEEQEKGKLAKRVEGQVIDTSPENTLDLTGRGGQLDLSGLTEEQKQTLKIKAAETQIENASRMEQIGQDVNTLAHSLGTMGENTKQMAEDQTSVTISQVREDQLGRTEVMVGTSDAARRGKFSRSQTGEFNWPALFIILGIIAVVIVVVVIAG